MSTRTIRTKTKKAKTGLGSFTAEQIKIVQRSNEPAEEPNADKEELKVKPRTNSNNANLKDKEEIDVDNLNNSMVASDILNAFARKEISDKEFKRLQKDNPQLTEFNGIQHQNVRNNINLIRGSLGAASQAEHLFDSVPTTEGPPIFKTLRGIGSHIQTRLRRR